MRIAIIAIVVGMFAIVRATATDMPQPAGGAHACSEYPAAALEADASGDAKVAFDIDPDGSVANPHIEISSGNADLDAASKACVSGWRYQPRETTLSWKALVEWRVNNVMPRAPSAAPHTCAFEPTPGEKSRITDRAAAQFLVGVNGMTSEVTIAKSSGDALLDQTFLKCISDWKYMPATRNGIPIEVSWGAQMEWTEQNGIRIGENGAKPHMCFSYPPGALRQVEGTTVLSFKISDTGHVEQVVIVQSSGSADLDNATIACSGHWKYLAATQDGKPIAVNWGAQVTWRNGHSFVLELQPPAFWQH